MRVARVASLKVLPSCRVLKLDFLMMRYLLPHLDEGPESPKKPCYIKKIDKADDK